MTLEDFKALYQSNKEQDLSHRYITNSHIKPLFSKLNKIVEIETIGYSVLNNPIYGLKIGSGEKRILMWSQMHGNESTTTKAIFDLLNTLVNNSGDINYILNSCSLYIIPILNPDGARSYTRINANEVDLNRDAQNLTQPESIVLQNVFNTFKPHFCYNLHGQRTIFSAGKTNKVATVSFLAPAQDKDCTVTKNRTRAMEIISVMNTALQQIIPNQVGVYDDAFNINCVGDTFQSKNVPTILFEAGHFNNDYGREFTRELIYLSYIVSLDYISLNDVTGENYKAYFNIPENEKLFFDVIIKNARNGNDETVDIAIQYQERLSGDLVVFVPKVEKIGNLGQFYAHKNIDANSLKVKTHKGEVVNIGYENDFVIIENEKVSLFS
ncbi:M14 family zinc carboxypeptidase [Gaetbulibacter saemankumensis]|uniref:M14 family zinc carboxypeptidase n=1 Tax=Gaetbulibacter saemankumensis TaxID=311208 RepID=UPI0004079BFE|nr:M14 family zinc carboxypeptidase [Gaetbulibacter saemankumensis]